MALRNRILPNVKTKGGVKVDHRKNTADYETETMPVPKQVAVAMSQHIGAPCVPCVKKGDTVCVGTLLGDSDQPVSSPVYSGVSGVVSSITDIMLATGVMTKAVVIDTDGQQTVCDQLERPVLETKQDLLDAVRRCGLVGLGGAGFPAHIKLNPAQPIDTLVINAAECEPYITADYREMIECAKDVIDGIYFILKYLDIPKAVIVVEDNKPKAIELLSQIANDHNFSDRFFIMRVSSQYPKGAEKLTVYLATGRKIPAGKLPADVGCIVMNVSSVSTIAKYVKTGMPLVQKRLTVDGSAIVSPKNVFVPVGTYIKDVIAFAGGYKKEPKKIIMGGPMMGYAMPDDEHPIMKYSNAILALDEKEAYPKEMSACIRCGRCVQACPMRLMPTKVEAHLKVGDKERLQKDGVLNCMECGCCAYVCPACRPLVQVMRRSKAIVK